MAGEIIRPKDLTPRTNPVASELMVVDNSVNVGAATIKAIVEAGRPAASQVEAQTGTDAAKAMTPLTTKQSIAAEVGVSVASKAQGDLAATAVQPSALGSAAAADVGDFATSVQGGKADTALQSVVPGLNVAIDNTDPRNPIVSASGGAGGSIPSRAWAIDNLHPAAAPDGLRTDGYATAGDGGGALYKKVASEPAHAGKLSITLANGSTVVWYELAESSVMPQMFGVVGDGSNEAINLQKWAAHPAKHKRAGAGTYHTTSEVVFAPNVRLDASPDAIFSTAGSGLFSFGNDFVVLPALNANVSAFASAIVFASAHGLSAGDVVRLSNRVSNSWYPDANNTGGAGNSARTYYHAGEDVVVASITNSTTVTLATPLMYGYAAANIDCLKIADQGPRITGGIWKTTGNGALRVHHCKYVSINIDAVEVTGTGYFAVTTDRCFVVDMVVSGAVTSADAGLQYLIVNSCSTHVRISGGGTSTRHVVATGGNAEIGNIPTRHMRVRDMLLAGVTTAGADVHGDSEDMVYERCIIYGGAVWGGKGTRYLNCTIYEYGPGNGNCVFPAEIVGGLFEVSGCTLISNSNPGDFGEGLCSMSNQNGGYHSQVPIILRLKDNICVAPSHIRGILNVTNFANGSNIGIDVQDNDFTACTSMTQSIVETASSLTKWLYIKVLGNMGMPASADYFYQLNGNSLDWANVPHAFPAQTGTVVLSATASNEQSASVSYKRQYPAGALPVPVLSGRKKNATNLPIVAMVDNMTATGFTAYWQTPDNSAIGAGITSYAYRWSAVASTL